MLIILDKYNRKKHCMNNSYEKTVRKNDTTNNQIKLPYLLRTFSESYI